MADQLTVSVSVRQCCMVVALAGEVDANTAGQLRDVLAAQGESAAGRVVVDLSALGFIGCRGMHALLDAQTALIARGKTMALAGPRPLVARVLQLTGVDQRIPVYEHVKEAVAGWVALPELAAAARRGGRTVASRSAPGLVHMA